MQVLKTKIQNASSNRERGAVLFIVLGIVFLMSLIVTLFLELSVKKMREQAINYSLDDLRPSAYSALEITFGVMNVFAKYDNGLRSLNQGWEDPLGFSEIVIDPDLDIKVSFEDETGKFPFLSADSLMLQDIFSGMGFDLSDAQTLSDSLLDWMDADDQARLSGAEEDYYEREDPPYKPPNRPITSFSELRYIQGFKEWFFDENNNPNEKYQQLVTNVSLHHQSMVNINTISLSGIGIFDEMDGADIDSLIEQRKGDDLILGTADDQIIQSSGGVKYIGSNIEVLKITVDVARADAHFILNALVSIGGQSSGSGNKNKSTINYPFAIIQLAENQPIE